MTAKYMFSVFAGYYGAVHAKTVEILEVRKKPAWCPYEDHTYTVYFRTTDMKPGYALWTGHGVSYEDAYLMLFNYCMETRNLTWPELKIRAAIYGVTA